MFKSKWVFVVLFLFVGAISCKKNSDDPSINITPPNDSTGNIPSDSSGSGDEDQKKNFDVSTSKGSFSVGETVKFTFTGTKTPDSILFYSGEEGNNYSARATTVTSKKFYYFFETRIYLGEQEDQVHITVSTDFSGVYDSADVVDATWTDITDRFQLDTAGTSHYQPSGQVDITDVVEPDKPFYIAHEYIDRDDSTYGRWHVVRIRNNVLSGYSDQGEETDNFSFPDLDFHLVKLGNWEDGKRGAYINGGVQLVNNGNTEEYGGETEYKEAWAISKDLNLKKEIIVEGDTSIVVKAGTNDSMKDNYSFVYDTPGSYEAIFIATDSDEPNGILSIKKVNIVITQ